jgi:PmbA protein
VGERPEPAELASRIAGWARSGEQVEAYVARGRETEIRVYEGDVESLTAADFEGVGVRVVAGNRQGFAYAGSLDGEVVAETLAEARDNAAFATFDEFAGLAGPDGVEPVALDVYRAELASFPTVAKVDMALELDRRVRGGDPRIRGAEVTAYTDFLSESAVATSTGIAASSRRTGSYVWSHAIAGEGAETQTGAGAAVARQPGDLDLDKAAGEAIEKATRLLGARKPASARLTVVLEPRVTASFLSTLAATLSGEAVLKGRSPFADRVGEEVGVPAFTLVDDPTDAEAFLASPYDAEGLACRPTRLIDAGVLQGFLYNTYAARRAGTRSTASAVRAGFKSGPGVGARAVSLVPGHAGPDEIVGSLERGLLVQAVAGLHSGVNPVSGDFSVGAEGVMIRGGALAEPVRELTIASTIQRMLRNVVAVGDDLEWSAGAAARITLAVADVSIGGQ